MTRRLVAGLVVLGLAIGVWALWPRGEPDSSPTTTVNAVASTSPTVAARTTSSASIETRVVTTVEEAEEILRQLWFGWFEGIYNQDAKRIKDVVGTQTALENAVAQFGVMEFSAVPKAENIEYSNTELLHQTEECLVVWTTTHLSGFITAETADVHVLRWSEGGWLFASLWVHRNDLWETDCESQLEPLV